jgi:hypothetical protein
MGAEYFDGGEKMGESKGRTPITPKVYDKLFGIEPEHIDKSRLEEALKRAWETRNFEIDKFWTRVAYFWGFIALIFGAYITVITEETGKAIDMHLDLYLVLLGGIFSIAWLLVIRGSKCWQQNWEEHINRLENSITGPLYKTIYCTRKPYYSVSGINKILAWTVIGVWIILLFECVVRKIETFCAAKDWFALLSILAAAICIIMLYNKGKSDDGNFRVKKGNNEAEGFIRIGKETKGE